MERWTIEEQEQMDKYFTTNITEMTLYKRLHNINPNRTYEAMMRRLRRMREQGYVRNKDVAIKKLRIGYLDIEATNLNGNYGFMLSWYIKTKGKNEYKHSVIKKGEIYNYSFDKRLVEELLEALKHYDVLYTHYGSDWRFDIPFIRTRAFRHSIEDKLPDNMEKFIMDTYPIAKSKLKLSSNRLGTIAELLGIKNVKKTSVDPDVWERAIAGDPKALEYVRDHNKKDVQILERVHSRLEKVEKPIYRSM